MYMTEHLVMDTREYDSRKIDSLQSSESDPQQGSALSLGVRAVGLSHSMDTMRPPEQVTNFGGTTEMDDMKDKSINPEGSRNAELFKQAYGTAIASIESAFEADSTEIGDKLDAILKSIDVLSGTPYIASAPEFAGLVEAARQNVELARSNPASDRSSEVSHVVAYALSQAKQQLDATTVAYRP